MEDFKVNILGSEYDVLFKSIEEDENLDELNAYCDSSVNKVVVRSDLMNRTLRCKEDLSKFNNKTIRHELIHAFMDESGVAGVEWCHDESLVDWIAVQMPKMFVVMKDYM